MVGSAIDRTVREWQPASAGLLSGVAIALGNANILVITICIEI